MILSLFNLAYRIIELPRDSWKYLKAFSFFDGKIINERFFIPPEILLAYKANSI